MDIEKFTDKNSRSVTVRMPMEMYEQIEKMAKSAERKPAEQIRFMIRKYIEIKEKD